ncbi:MAG: hypothetical protein AB1Z29_06775 [Desulfobacterales bacterium]|jgi:pimeloyl-ACP methyl ester carboxylesterase
MMILYIGSGILLLFLVFSLFLTYLVQQIPRQSVHDPPDWGTQLIPKFLLLTLKMPAMIIHGEKDRRFPLQFA